MTGRPINWYPLLCGFRPDQANSFNFILVKDVDDFHECQPLAKETACYSILKHVLKESLYQFLLGRLFTLGTFVDVFPFLKMWSVDEVGLIVLDKYTYTCHIDGGTSKPLIVRFMGPTWGPSGADRTQVCPRWVPRTLLSGTLLCIRQCVRIHGCQFNDFGQFLDSKDNTR